MPREIAPGVFSVGKILSKQLHSSVAVGEAIGNGSIQESDLDAATATKFNARIQSYASASEMIQNAPAESMAILNDKLFYRDTGGTRFFMVSENVDSTSLDFPTVSVATPGASTATYASGSTLPSANIQLDTDTGSATTVTFDPATLGAGVSIGMFALTDPPQATSVTFANNVLTIQPSTDIANNGSFGVRMFARDGDSQITHRFNFELAIPTDTQGPTVTSVTRTGQSGSSVTNTFDPPAPATAIAIDSSQPTQARNRFIFAYNDQSQPVTAAFSFTPASPDQVTSHTVVANPDANTVALDIDFSVDQSNNGTFDINVALTDSLGNTATYTQAVSLNIQKMGLVGIQHNVDETNAPALWNTSGWTWSAPREYTNYNPSTQKWAYQYTQGGENQSGQTSEPGFIIHPAQVNHLDLQFLPGAADSITFSVTYDPANPSPPLESYSTSVLSPSSSIRRIVFDPPLLSNGYPANTYFKVNVSMTKSGITQQVPVYFVYQMTEGGYNASQDFVMNFIFTEPELDYMTYEQTGDTSYTPRYAPHTSIGATHAPYSRFLSNGVDYHLIPFNRSTSFSAPEIRIFADHAGSYNEVAYYFIDRPNNDTDLTFEVSTTPANPVQIKYPVNNPSIASSGPVTHFGSTKTKVRVGFVVGYGAMEQSNAHLSGTFQLHLKATDSNGVSFTRTDVCRLQVFPAIDPANETRQAGNGTSVTTFDGVVSGSIISRNTYLYTNVRATSSNNVRTTVSYVNEIAAVDYNKGVRHWSIQTDGNTSSTQPYIGYDFGTGNWRAVTRVKFVGHHSTSFNTSNIRFDYLNTAGEWINLAITSIRNRTSGQIDPADRTLNFEGASSWTAQGWYHDDVVSSNRHNEFTVDTPVWATKYRLRYIRAQTDYGYGQTETHFGRTSVGSVEYFGVAF